MELSERIQQALLHSGKTQAAVAREMGITPSAITQWLSGRTKTLKAETAIALEKATGMKAAWIATGVGHKLVDSNAPADHFPLPVLLVSWHQAAMWIADEDGQEDTQKDVWVPSPVEHSDHAFALRVGGASMFNPTSPVSFSDGDLIYVEQYSEAKNGSIVIARIGNRPEAIFRQLLIEGESKYLQALNPAWPQRIIDVKNENVTLGGVVVARTTIFNQ